MTVKHGKSARRTSKTYARGRFVKKFYVSRRRMPKMRAFFRVKYVSPFDFEMPHGGIMEVLRMKMDIK